MTCDPCSTHNISKVTEPETCHYRVEISSYAGCATNKPPPSASCPHVCDRVNVPTVPSAFGFVDEISKKALATKTVTPAGAPIGNTEVLLGLQLGGGADFGMQVVSLVDAPEGGTCHP